VNTVLFLCLLAGHAAALWWYVRRESSTPSLGEAYRDETLNRHSDPL
jgi:hypothetical protein